MFNATQGIATPLILLDSLEEMKTFVRKNKFPHNIPKDKLSVIKQEYMSIQQKSGEAEADRIIQSKYCVSVKDALTDFHPIATPDNDKRKRKKKVSLRIVAEEGQTKCVVISPGLFELLGEPTHVSFQAKDNVLAIGRGLPSSKDYRLHVDHNGYVVKSESLVDYLCDYYKLLGYSGTMNTSEAKPFKTAFSDFREVVLKRNNALETVVFIHIPSNR